MDYVRLVRTPTRVTIMPIQPPTAPVPLPAQTAVGVPSGSPSLSQPYSPTPSAQTSAQSLTLALAHIVRAKELLDAVSLADSRLAPHIQSFAERAAPIIQHALAIPGGTL